MNHFNAEQIARDAAAKASTPPELKRPLRRETPPPDPYPMAALLDLRAPVEAIQRRTQAPQALCAASVLAAASFATSIHHDVEIPNVGPRPLVTAFLTIAQSGERKTSVDHLASLPIRRAETALAARYDADLSAYSRDKEAFEAARIEARKAAKDGRRAAEQALADVGSEPKAPAPPMLTAEEGTIEGLINLLTMRPYAAIFSAEGGMFLGGHAMSEDAAVRTMTTVNTLWDGSPIKRLRAGKSTFALGRRASLSLAVQRSVAGILLGNAGARDNGLLARMLIAEPDSTIGTRMWREREPDFDQFLDDYNDRLAELLGRPPHRLEGSDGLDPDALSFNVAAERRLIVFHDATERDLADGRRYAPIRGFGAKMVEHAARLAGILAAYGGRDLIDAETFDAGAELASWYAGEQLRIGEAVAPDPEFDAAQELLAWWQAQPDPRLYLTALYKSGPNRLRKADDAKRAVAILEDHNWIERLPAGTVLDGSPRREAWGLVP
ncbi:YfjI family protein [Acidiphilium multivorum]|uniref:YfjI family protein n=1 Tax=Acidiphilium multivorum TaxID=62140 RepID=UPI0039C9DFE4